MEKLEKTALTSPATSFAIEYPRQAANAIVENREYLEKLIPHWGWEITIFAGYNDLPEGYRDFYLLMKPFLHISDFQGIGSYRIFFCQSMSINLQATRKLCGSKCMKENCISRQHLQAV